jgi:general stress protein 26
MTKPAVLRPAEIDKLLSMTLIANLGTIDEDDSIHLLPMWLKRIGNEICIPTSHNTHKSRNLRARSRASVMIDVSKAGLNLKGVLIRGKVKLVDGEEAQRINRSSHLKYVTSEAQNDPNVASYLSKGDDITIKISMDHLISWNLADSKAGQAVSEGGWYQLLEQAEMHPGLTVRSG